MTNSHATDPLNSEFTLCGNAFDASEGDNPNDLDGPRPNFASDGELVTCESCRRAIDEIRTIKRYRYPVGKEQ